MMPPSHVDLPDVLCPPARTAVSSLCSRAKFTARMTSAAPTHDAMSAGRLSMVPFHTRRACS